MIPIRLRRRKTWRHSFGRPLIDPSKTNMNLPNRYENKTKNLKLKTDDRYRRLSYLMYLYNIIISCGVASITLWECNKFSHQNNNFVRSPKAISNDEEKKSNCCEYQQKERKNERENQWVEEKYLAIFPEKRRPFYTGKMHYLDGYRMCTDIHLTSSFFLFTFLFCCVYNLSAFKLTQKNFYYEIKMLFFRLKIRIKKVIFCKKCCVCGWCLDLFRF